MRYSEDLIEEIRMKNDIVDVISDYVKLQKKGGSYFGLCPFHGEKTPSFSVSAQRQMYHCFGCGVGGNVITFIMEYENYTFLEALKYLADKAGISLPEVEYSKEAKEAADLRSQLLEMNKEAAKYFYYQLKSPGGELARTYFAKRELTDKTIQKFGLGYSDKYSKSLYQYMKSKNYQTELLHQSGLFNVDEKQGMYDKFWNRVIFPIMDVNHRVIGFGGRVLGDGKPKYLNSPETKIFDKSRNLYGLNFARTSRKPYLIICEGYMDVIAMHQAGFDNAVASLGTALTSQQASLLKRYTDEVLLIYDSDEAGIKAAERAIPILKNAGLATKVVDLSPFKDPDEFMKNRGALEFEERLKKAKNSFLYQVENLKKSFDMEDPQGKTDFHNKVAERLLEFEEEIERNNYLEAVSKEQKIPYEELRKLVNKKALRGFSGENYQKPKSGLHRKKEQESGIEKSQKLMLTWLVNYPGVFPAITPYIAPKDFTNDLYRQVAELLFEQYRKEGKVNPARILNHFPDKELQTQITSFFHSNLHLESAEQRNQAITDTVIRMQKNSLDHAFEHIGDMDIQALQSLLARKKEIEDFERSRRQIEVNFS